MDSETQVDITMQVRKGLSVKQPVQDRRLQTEEPSGGTLSSYLGPVWHQEGRGEYKKIF